MNYVDLSRFNKDSPHDIPQEDRGHYKGGQAIQMCCVPKDWKAARRDDWRMWWRRWSRKLEGMGFERQGWHFPAFGVQSTILLNGIYVSRSIKRVRCIWQSANVKILRS